MEMQLESAVSALKKWEHRERWPANEMPARLLVLRNNKFLLWRRRCKLKQTAFYVRIHTRRRRVCRVRSGVCSASLSF